MFAEQLAKVFVLLLESSLRVRTEAISVAMAERARLTLYLQHDMRNLAQWVGWVCADFIDCQNTEQLWLAANRLQQNAPLARERADRLMASLGNQPSRQQATLLDLRHAVENEAHLAGVQIAVSGQASVWIAPALLARALDNLFSNLAPNWRNPGAEKPVLHLQTIAAPLARPAMAELRFFSAWPEGKPHISAGRLFEPFASGRPGGLGLGLYQARKSLREGGGDLRATAGANGLHFVLRLPVAAA
jgi:signal transduction histidine kinase